MTPRRRGSGSSRTAASGSGAGCRTSAGINLTAGFFQYLVPTATDVPDIEVIILESGEGMGPFGARGIGEPPIGPPLAAVANAIRDAVGTRPTTLPVTPEQVLACLRSAPLGTI
jgi:CO/xanthine dehydrogenase Mo-binding subunit